MASLDFGMGGRPPRLSYPRRGPRHGHRVWLVAVIDQGKSPPIYMSYAARRSTSAVMYGRFDQTFRCSSDATSKGSSSSIVTNTRMRVSLWVTSEIFRIVCSPR